MKISSFSLAATRVAVDDPAAVRCPGGIELRTRPIGDHPDPGTVGTHHVDVLEVVEQDLAFEASNIDRLAHDDRREAVELFACRHCRRLRFLGRLLGRWACRPDSLGGHGFGAACQDEGKRDGERAPPS
jgi:hypothetical protein